MLGIVKHPGAFREFLTLPERNLHRVPREIPTEHAVFVEPLAAACEILDQVRIPAGARVAVLGDGKLGLLVGQVLKAHGAEVHQYGRHKEKLQDRVDGRASTREWRGSCQQAKYDWVVDATGSSEGLRQAVRDDEAARHGGHEIDGSRDLVGDRLGAGDRQRDHPGRIALRPFRAGAPVVADEDG